jgi:hypothetical protein
VAASRAAKLFCDITRLGWDAALVTMDPDRYTARQVSTVGDVIAALDRVDMRPRTRANYQGALRWWAALHLGARGGTKEFGRQNGEWRALIAVVTLSDLTLNRLERIRDSHIAAASADAVTD